MTYYCFAENCRKLRGYNSKNILCIFLAANIKCATIIVFGFCFSLIFTAKKRERNTQTLLKKHEQKQKRNS